MVNMQITCISASNTVSKKDQSTSTRVCNLIKDQILEENEEIKVCIEPLMNYDLKPCILCGKCCDIDKCLYDENFNKLYRLVKSSDAIFFVVPHYSPIPSKLIMIFEKMNEILYANWIKDSTYLSPFKNIPIGIIGHGGMPETKETLDYYHNHLVIPIANTLRSLTFNVIGVDEVYQHGAVFGLKDDHCIKKDANHIFPNIIQDYEMIKKRIEPLVVNVLSKI